MPEPALRVLTDPPDDLALRRAFAAGDPEALGPLAAPHLNALYTLCLRLTQNSATAEDLAQESLVRALRNASRYDPSRAFRPWLLTIGLNVARDHLRAVWWSRVTSFEGLLRTSAPEAWVEDPSADAALDDAQRDRRVRAALATLPRKYREAVSLFHLEDMTYAEMSEITGVKVPALKQRVRRGCLMLRDAVEQMYPDLRAPRS